MKCSPTAVTVREQYQTPLRGLHQFYVSFNKVNELKKNIVLLLLINLCLLTTQAQTAKSYKKEDFDVRHFRVKKISIAAPESLLEIKNMHGMAVLDLRADTSMVGFMQKKIVDPIPGLFNSAEIQTEQRVNKKPTFISLREGLQRETLQFIQHSINFRDDTSLPGILMVIKKLWLSDELNLNYHIYADSRFAGPASLDVWTSGIDVTIEFYLHDGNSYYPMYRYDSVISKALTISEYGSQYIALAFQLAMGKLAQMDSRIPVIMNKTKFSLAEIKLHIQNDYNVPALRDTAFRQGVYMSFNEFKNNNPSKADFELKRDRLADIVYIKQQDGTDYVARNIWGYCDGKNVYVASADNFFLLQRIANAFYIFGAKSPKRNESRNNTSAGSYNGAPGAPVPYQYNNVRTAIQLEPFQLDWSTGKLY